VAYGLWRLKQQVANETSICWVMVGAAAVASWPIGSMICSFAFSLITLMVPSLLDSYSSAASMPAVGFFQTSFAILSLIGGALLPAGIVWWAIREYRTQYRFTAGDLVWNDVALFLLHDEYGAIIEEARREHYRPNPNPVGQGDSLAQRLTHFAAYYNQYRKLARPSGELRVPNAIGHNPWAEGGLLLAGCCTAMFCVGWLILVPLIIHIITTWPRQMAIKQAVVHFFEGRFDHQFPQVVENG
jgi:hypothetical protein